MKPGVFLPEKMNKLPRAEARGFLGLRTEITSAQPATADIAPGGHSSPGLKARGFLAVLIK